MKLGDLTFDLMELQAIPPESALWEEAGVHGFTLNAGACSTTKLLQSATRYSSQPFHIKAEPRGSLSNLVTEPWENLIPGQSQTQPHLYNFDFR